MNVSSGIATCSAAALLTAPASGRDGNLDKNFARDIQFGLRFIF